MDIDFIAIGRVLERLLIVGAGAMCVYLGYRLFDRVQRRQGELQLKGEKASVTMRDLAPGVYFALFGSLLLAAAVFTTLETSDPRGAGTRKYLRSDTQSETKAIDQQLKNGILTHEQAYEKLRTLVLQAKE